MIDRPVNLSPLCHLQIARLNALSSIDPRIRSTCNCGDEIVAVLTDDVPLGLALPGGITSTASSESVTIASLAKTSQSRLSTAVVPLRYHTSLLSSFVDPSAEISSLLQSVETITIGRMVLNPNQTVGDVVAENDSQVKLVQLYRTQPNRRIVSYSKCPPALVFPSRKERRAGTALNIDVLAYVKRSASFRVVLQAISEAMQRFVQAAVAVIAHFRPSSIVARHFVVMGGDLAATVVVPDLPEDDARMVELRKRIHDVFLLPVDRPLFRAACRVLSISPNKSTVFDGGFAGRLSDVHVGIKSHGLETGSSDVEEHLVQGTYLYCHYQQDKCNDSGWGCAYRSLQTLISWCVSQGYMTMRGGKLPSHLEIQRALVEVGDKPERFVGSKEWIGANEVCYALEKLTNVSSKIIHVSRGSEMASQARQLARHFKEQGSPVMVGGGVLAWTILGVTRNERTGVAKFLILDPHYEGRDDLRTIQSKGWVAWKSVDTFRDDAFYNLCLPQRPTAV